MVRAIRPTKASAESKKPLGRKQGTLKATQTPYHVPTAKRYLDLAPSTPSNNIESFADAIGRYQARSKKITGAGAAAANQENDEEEEEEEYQKERQEDGEDGDDYRHERYQPFILEAMHNSTRNFSDLSSDSDGVERYSDIVSSPDQAWKYSAGSVLIQSGRNRRLRYMWLLIALSAAALAAWRYGDPETFERGVPDVTADVVAREEELRLCYIPGTWPRRAVRCSELEDGEIRDGAAGAAGATRFASPASVKLDVDEGALPHVVVPSLEVVDLTVTETATKTSTASSVVTERIIVKEMLPDLEALLQDPTRTIYSTVTAWGMPVKVTETVLVESRQTVVTSRDGVAPDDVDASAGHRYGWLGMYGVRSMINRNKLWQSLENKYYTIVSPSRKMTPVTPGVSYETVGEDDVFVESMTPQDDYTAEGTPPPVDVVRTPFTPIIAESKRNAEPASPVQPDDI